MSKRKFSTNVPQIFHKISTNLLFFRLGRKHIVCTKFVRSVNDSKTPRGNLHIRGVVGSVGTWGNGPSFKADSDTTERKRMSTEKRYAQWRQESAHARSKLSISSSFDSWSAREDVAGLPAAMRQVDVANVAWAARMKSSPAGTTLSDLRNGYWVDLSQSVKRAPWGRLGCVTCECMWYSFQYDSCLSGWDFVKSQGLPRGVAPAAQFSNADLRSLGGEAFACPCIGVATAAFWLNPWAPWWKGATDQI